MSSPGTWVIIEGPDGAGKTTAAGALVAALTRRRPTVSQHLDSRSAYEEYGRPHMWTRAGLDVVQDRHLVSDLVYSPVLFGPPSRLGEGRVRAEMAAVALKAVVLHFTADEDELAARLEERGDDLVDAGMLHAILQGYWLEMGAWIEQGAVVVEFDTTGGHFPGELELELAVSSGMADLAARA